ncbi:MAG: UDP-N-acetylmuramoyl-L-alanyl-D-glutamate--2,6-diaminopimelate ligase [Rhizomicrobium sp.]|nr:UDP-N-acetylmuramoyl-L-alanyl-D-glutamate--2,6-diaminopimelate ligase [Rhizomicrobium sp.]
MPVAHGLAVDWEAVKGFTGLASDSRQIKAGYLFAAIAGTKGDGAQFVADAVARGAVAVLGHPTLAEAVAAAGVAFIPADNPRLALAHYAAAFYGPQPKVIAAVTGTNGKTSIAVFLREIWTRLGKPAASMGTIGVVTPARTIKLDNTTPGPIEVQSILAELKAEGIDHLALEASSHGLDQYRLDGVDIAAVAVTNITRDHLDYHPSFEAYIQAKLRLFRDLARDGAAAVINADADYADRFIAAAAERGLRLFTVGEHGGGLKLITRQPTPEGQILEIVFAGQTYTVALPLAGAFQASNALVAAGLAIGLGEDPVAVFEALTTLIGAPGRLEKVAIAASGAPIFVDYAHTPDALETVLLALRPHTMRKLSVVFGCGGDRDKGKRPLMGESALRLADRVIVTDDNPRSEMPREIRSQILAACPGASEIADRALAIHTGISELSSGDVLVIAGKGHESGQIVGATIHPFNDRDEAIKAAIAQGGREYLP